MNFLVNDRYRITSDSRCWRVERSRLKDGRSEWRADRWYTTLTAAVKALGARMARESDSTSEEGAIAAIRRIADELDEALVVSFHVEDLCPECSQRLREQPLIRGSRARL